MNNLGTVEIITFRATRYEHPYLESILALLRGTSTGHIALRLTFNDTELYNKYIRDNNNIPHRRYIDPKDHKPIYEVYVSFWPGGTWSPWHDTSTLKSHLFDCEQSANYSQFNYDPQRALYFKPLQKPTSSSIPGLKGLTHSIITLPPSIILHTSRLGIAFGDKTCMQPNLNVVAKAEEYAKTYHAWRSALVKEQNIKKLQPQDKDLQTEYSHYTKSLQLKLAYRQNQLGAAMFPDKALSDEEFHVSMEPFVTFGYPERDTVSLPLSRHGSPTGIEIEPMLSYINTISKYPNIFPYNVLGNNCARMVYDILWEGCKYSPLKQLQKVLLLPWFIRLFNFTITPAYLIRHLAKLQIAIEYLRNKTQSVEPTATQVCPETPRRSSIDQSLTNKPTRLTFSRDTDNTDEDEIPSTSLGINRRMLENVTEHLRQ